MLGNVTGICRQGQFPRGDSFIIRSNKLVNWNETSISNHYCLLYFVEIS